MKLQDLHDIFKMRHGNKPVSRAKRIFSVLFYSTIVAVFALIIVSFISFYGWSQNSKNAGGAGRDFARLRSGSLNPFDRWLNLDNRAMREGARQAKEEKMQMLGQYGQFFQRQGLMDRMISHEDAARAKADSILTERAAERMGIESSEKDVIEMLKSQPGMTRQRLENLATQNDETPDELIEQIRKEQEINRVRAMKSMMAHASLFEIWQEYRLDKEKISLAMGAYPLKDFEKQVVVTDADLEKYLTGHKDDFHVAPQRRYAFVKLSKQDLIAQLKPTPAQLQAYYEQNQADFKQEPATKIETIFAPLAEDKPSTTAVKVLSEARVEAGKNKDWATLTQDLNKKNPTLNLLHESETWVEDNSTAHDPNFLKRIKTLSEDRVSTPIADSRGTYMVRVLGRRQGATKPLAEIRTHVEELWKAQEADKRMNAEADRFKEAVKRLQEKGGAVTMRALAQDLKLKDELTTRVLATATTLPGLGSLAENSDYLAGLKENELSDVIQTPDLLAVVQVVEALEGYDPKLGEVRGKVEEAYRQAHGVELARGAAEQSLKLVQSGAEFAKALSNAPKAPFETQPFTRADAVPGLESPLNDFAKQTLKIAVGSTGMSSYGYDAKKPTGFAVWMVKKIDPPSQAEFIKDQRKIEKDYLQIQRGTILQEWLADQRRQADFQLIE